MQPLYFEVDNKLSLMVIPESEAHVDGHPVLTYTYVIYKDESLDGHHLTVDTAKLLAPDRIHHPNYLGTLTFVQPGKMFSYAADGRQSLESREVEEVIEQVTHYRENPALWQV